jgi:S-adenosylmethionine synthetase
MAVKEVMVEVLLAEKTQARLIEVLLMLQDIWQKNLVAAGIADEILVQLSYAIGVIEPTSVYINTYGTANVKLTDQQIAKKARLLFDLRPYAVEQRLKLRNPMYLETASYGHMGRMPRTITKTFESPYNGKVSKKVELFTWEQLDYITKIKKSFQL